MATRNSGPSGSRTRSTPSRSPCPRCSTAPRPTPSSTTPGRATTTTTPSSCSTTCRHSAIPACAGSAENASAEGKRRRHVGDSSSPRGPARSRLRSRSRQQATPPHPRILSMSPHARPRHPRARPRGPRIEPVGAPGSRTTSLVREPRKGGHMAAFPKGHRRTGHGRIVTCRAASRSPWPAASRNGRIRRRAPTPATAAADCTEPRARQQQETASSDSGPDIRHRVDAGRSRYRAAQLQDRHRPPCLATAESVARGRAAPARGRLSCAAGQRAVVERADVNPILVYMVVPRVERDHRRSSALMADLVIVEPPRKDEQHHRGPRGRTAWSARRSGTRATCCR